jgi:S1-C subfamily serine protease
MKKLIRSPFVASVMGGAVVAVAFLALGVTGHRSTKTIVQEAPVASGPSPGSGGLTPHEIYARDAPGVVFVRARIIQQVQDPFDMFPQQQSSFSTGSGFLIDRDGRILTNYHVIEGANRRTGVVVRFEDDITRRATVVGEDPDDDLAVLRVNLSGLSHVAPLASGDSSTVKVGDPTLAIGNPFGLDRTLTSGIVSALQRQIEAPDGFSIDNVIQTDAPINPGNSGGPLLDATGKVIGINSQIATGGGGGNGSVGIAFAVPINTAKALLPRLEGGGEVKPAYLGVTAGPAASRGERSGVVIARVAAGGPAAVAGLRPGDRIVAIGGHRVSSMSDVETVEEARIPGQVVGVRAARAHEPARTFQVALGVRPPQAPH